MGNSLLRLNLSKIPEPFVPPCAGPWDYQPWALNEGGIRQTPLSLASLMTGMQDFSLFRSLLSPVQRWSAGQEGQGSHLLPTSVGP